MDIHAGGSMYSTSSNTPNTSSCTSPSGMSSPECATPPEFELLLLSHKLSPQILSEIRNELVAIAHHAGTIMLIANAEFQPAIETKKNTSDLVTATDKAIEAMAQAHLLNKFPDIDFLGEETAKVGRELEDAPLFICDPIDGTINFVHGFPNCAISLALTLEKKPIIGVVYNPFRGDLYTAIKHQGAFLTKVDGQTQRLPVRPIAAPLNLTGALCAIEWGSQRSGPNWMLRTSVAQQLMTSQSEGGAMIRSIRSSGSAALDLCYTAQGSIDLFWEGGCWAWDVAGGWCILEEAGGIVVSANPGDWNPTLEGRVYFAVRGAMRGQQEAVVKGLWALMGDRKFVF